MTTCKNGPRLFFFKIFVSYSLKRAGNREKAFMGVCASLQCTAFSCAPLNVKVKLLVRMLAHTGDLQVWWLAMHMIIHRANLHLDMFSATNVDFVLICAG